MDTVVAAEFHPLDKNCIVTCGKNHISFWTLDAGGTLYKRQGLFEGSRDRPKYVTCLAFTQTGDVLSGDTNGNIIVWTRGTVEIPRKPQKHFFFVCTTIFLEKGASYARNKCNRFYQKLNAEYFNVEYAFTAT